MTSMDESIGSSGRELHELIASGQLALIPAGFRCHTKLLLSEKFHVSQESLPFDSGFFPPAAVASLLRSDRVDLAQFGSEKGHAVCMKFEHFMHEEFGNGIKFQTSSYEEIDELARDRNAPNINQFLDSTFGYYTCDLRNCFVLAHFNWHKFSDIKNSGGSYDVLRNITHASSILTKRVNRMHETCFRAKWVVFAIYDIKKYKYMMIDDAIFDLNDFDVILSAATEVYGNKCQVVALSQINSPQDILDIIS
ncbi:hypothetical protein [Azospirillum sp. B506]|uniref:hypothetical protein n=1 Tax=Azospirillum sp. B506 TaxID=137721 RepID=UPI0011DCB791|nr:hypothetical protein [Azospirillum sp. B506]